MSNMSHDFACIDGLLKGTFLAWSISLPCSPVASSAGSIMASGNQVLYIAGLFPLHLIIPVYINQAEIDASQSQLLLTDGSLQLLFGSQKLSFVRFKLTDLPTGHQ